MAPVEDLPDQRAAFDGEPVVGAEVDFGEDEDVVDRVGDVGPSSIIGIAGLPIDEVVMFLFPSFRRQEDDGAESGDGEFGVILGLPCFRSKESEAGSFPEDILKLVKGRETGQIVEYRVIDLARFPERTVVHRDTIATVGVTLRKVLAKEGARFIQARENGGGRHIDNSL